MIVDAETSLPLFDPTVFAMAELRKRNLAYATIKQAMHAIRILLQFMDARNIDLVERIHKQGAFLDMSEIEHLTSLCRLPQPQIDAELILKKDHSIVMGNVTNIEKFRKRPQKKITPQVGSESVNIRVHYIRGYLKWLAAREILRIGGNSGKYSAVREAVATCLGALKARQIYVGNRNVIKTRRKGLSENVISRIHEVLDPNSADNPWRFKFNRYRNRLYVYWLLDLALRKGEALSVTLEDIVFSECKVNILRRPDNPSDPRGIHAPHVKTRDRVIILGHDLLAYTEEYLEMRRGYVNSASHGYLFVSGRKGDPLSGSAARDIFHALRAKVPGMPADLTAHIMRHTWSSLFTAHAFATGMSDHTRVQIMRNQNGWSENSRMPDHYSFVAIEKKAQEEALKVQEHIHSLHNKE